MILNLSGMAFRCRICENLKLYGNVGIGCEANCGRLNEFKNFKLEFGMNDRLQYSCTRCGKPPKLIILNKPFTCDRCNHLFERGK